MQIAILGGTGGIGAHVLGWAQEAGHPMRALARRPEALPQREGPDGHPRGRPGRRRCAAACMSSAGSRLLMPSAGELVRLVDELLSTLE
jgi:nucleoside-diphosphate-sugar epimerase